MTVRIGPKNLQSVHVYLAEWREHFRLTQQQLADRINTTAATVSRHERWPRRGGREPTIGFLAAIAEAYSIPTIDLLHPPAEVSLDALVRRAPADVRQQAIGIIEALLKAPRARAS